ncbi:MAG: hypothetical protein ABTQ25_17560 [Nitrosomonas ureae]
MTSQERQGGHIKAWEASGLSQAAYCRDHGLNWWGWTLTDSI